MAAYGGPAGGHPVHSEPSLTLSWNAGKGRRGLSWRPPLRTYKGSGVAPVATRPPWHAPGRGRRGHPSAFTPQTISAASRGDSWTGDCCDRSGTPPASSRPAHPTLPAAAVRPFAGLRCPRANQVVRSGPCSTGSVKHRRRHQPSSARENQLSANWTTCYDCAGCVGACCLAVG